MKKKYYLKFLVLHALILLVLSSCSLQKKISASAKDNILEIPDLQSAHIGICIYESASNKFWYNYQSDKYFVPASNTKIFSLYAGLKYLGDSLPGINYTESGNDLYIIPTGDPSLLHPDFKNQPIIEYLQHTNKNIFIVPLNWNEKALGSGWSWDDYNDDYMPERSALPVYGNTIRFVQTASEGNLLGLEKEQQISTYTIPDIEWKIKFNADTAQKFSVRRDWKENQFTITQGKESYKEQNVPFITNGVLSAVELLKDTIGKEVKIINKFPIPNSQLHTIHSQPADSLFKPMMHRSDNFFAEQVLLMVSNQLLGSMNNEKIIDSLLNKDLKSVPQKPNWADGSGLSRFNLFTAQDFVWILNKIKTEFNWQRIRNIFPTGNQGTLTNYYISDSSFIYAKTGSLSGVIAISGYFTTRKNKDLIFSVLVNNHQTSGRIVRRAIEKFIQSIRDKY